jgi:hypothetical protein
MNIIRTNLAVCVLCSALCTAQAYAEEPANNALLGQSLVTAPATDQKTLEVAKEIVHIQYGMDTYGQKLEAKLDSYRTVILRDNPNQNEAIKKVISEDYIPVFTAHMDDFERISAEIYARNFTYNELQSILKFLKSPVGEKLHKLTPELLRQGNEVARPLRAELGHIAIQKLIEGLEANNLNVPKEISVWQKD